ncbi:MAG: alpha/beta fold hydrolase [Actinomycetota bacterium]
MTRWIRTLAGVVLVLLGMTIGVLLGAGYAAADSTGDSARTTSSASVAERHTARTADRVTRRAERQTARAAKRAERQAASSQRRSLFDRPREGGDRALVRVERAPRPPARTRAETPETPETPEPSPVRPVDRVGGVVLSLVMGLGHLVDGPPAVPADSTVTPRRSTLVVPVAGGRRVEANWYFPDSTTEPAGLIYLQHGFMASAPMYGYTAAALAERTNSIVVAPSLSSNFFLRSAAWLGGTPMQVAVADLFVGNRDALTASARAAAGHDVTLPTEVVLVGHSMGGSLVMGAARAMVDNGAAANLAGVVLLDAVDVNNAVPNGLQQLSGTNYRPVYDISSERYVWNMYGKVGDELAAARPGEFTGVMLVGGRHVDAAQGRNQLLQQAQYLLTGRSQPSNVEAAMILATGWVGDMLTGAHTGIYGTPGQTLSIDTPAGAATAVALPFPSDDIIEATPFDAVLATILNTLQSYFIYEPAARPVHARVATR